jgi:hypothetical protein
MALNAIGFAACMTERGQAVLAATVTPISIDFEYVPGVNGTSAAFQSTDAYCQANAVSLGNPLGLVYNYSCGSWAMPNTVAWAECELQGKV